ncbi:MAG: LysR family transcriptional regulator ArgP [Polaromonas sp.]|uniref:LysR family transcriptional regulator ArgP n=1 Tax=Polaromonas sp. TaxID=1869339 RepID=UPI0025E5B6A3|nr:LysR family transcriptional regulator ArgP [Polaromonas sp.]MBI2726246.1 LysR family transcriptional regulator ArgP [Polaromonas sp.]
MNLFDPSALECFAAVVEEGSYAQAAVRLSITQSAVSQRVRGLELQAGTVLVVRSKPVRATAAGRLLLKHTKQLRLLHTDLQYDLHALTPRANDQNIEAERISIAINADSIATWALPAIDGLVSSGLNVEVIADNQDFTQEWLREGRVLGCVTTVKQPLRGCKMTRLGSMRYVAVASQEIANKHFSDGLGRQNFNAVPFVSFDRKDHMQTELVRKVLGLKNVSLNQLFIPSSEGQVRAVLSGWGASVVPELLVRGLLEQRSLINISPTNSVQVELFWHCWNLDSAILHGLTKALVENAGKSLKN